MKKPPFDLTVAVTVAILILITLIVSCQKTAVEKPLQEEATAKAPSSKNCYTVCDVSKSPDLQLVTNAQEERPLLPDGQIDSLSYFFSKYHIRTRQILLTQNYITPDFYTTRYGWRQGDTVNRVVLQCLIENIAPFGCQNDWVFSQGQLDSAIAINPYTLFEFYTYEKGNGNNWKLLYEDYKTQFYPSTVSTWQYAYTGFDCWYDSAVQAQGGDVYNNAFRFPNHDGVYKLVIKFNPSVKGCRAVKETNYNNNEVTVILEITNGQVIIIK